jgi:hypothetical protein
MQGRGDMVEREEWGWCGVEEEGKMEGGVEYDVFIMGKQCWDGMGIVVHG